MAGFPGERDDDIDGIYELSQEVADAARPVRGMPARVSAAVGWLVPKPHTPLQWAAQPPQAYFEQVADRLQTWVRSRRTTVRFKMHDIARSILEAVLSRGDRRLGRVIETAWRAGARFDGWNEHFNENIWRDAFEKNGIDPAWYAHRERRLDEVLPWSHLAGGASTEYLRREYEDLLNRIKETRADPGGNAAVSTE